MRFLKRYFRRLYVNRIKQIYEVCLLLLLSCFSRVRLCATPETAAYQALGFSRQEHWSGLPIPSPMHESEKWKWSRSVVSYLCHPKDCSLPGPSVHGIFQARVLEWGATVYKTIISKIGKGLPWRLSGIESVCQCQRRSFDPWSGKIPQAVEQLSLWTTTTVCAPEPRSRD